MGSWRVRLLLQALLSLFQEMLLNAQPVLVLRLARLNGFSHVDAVVPAASMAGAVAIVEGLAGLVVGSSYEPSLLIGVLSAAIASSACGFAFFIEDLFMGLTVASVVYGIGVGLTRGLTTHCKDGAVSSQLHFNREVGGILGGFVGAPLLFVLDDLLLTKGAMLIVSGISLHAVAIVFLMLRNPGRDFGKATSPSLTSSTVETRSESSNCKKANGRADRHREEGPASTPLLDKAIELDNIESKAETPNLTTIDGRSPFAAARKHQSQDLGYRQRVNSFAEREFRSVSHHVLDRPPRRRLNTEPTDAEHHINFVQKIFFGPERSVSVDVLQHRSLSVNSRLNHAVVMGRACSHNSHDTITLAPVETPLPRHVAVCQTLCTGAFSLLLFTFISNANLFIVTTTVLDSYMDKVAASSTTDSATSLFALEGMDPVCIFLVFSLTKLVGVLVTDTLLRTYDTSEKTLVLLANFIGGFNLLATPFLNRFLLIAGWAALLGLVEGAVGFLQPNLTRLYLERRIEHTGHAMARVVTGIYVSIALPLCVYHYRDQPEVPSYDLLYQISGLIHLGVSYNWLFLEPFFDKPNLEDLDEDLLPGQIGPGNT